MDKFYSKFKKLYYTKFKRSLKKKVYMKNNFKFSVSSISRRNNVDFKLIEISDLALSISLVDFGIPKYGGRRTSEEQNQLYKSGNSECDGYIKKSPHQFGQALDVFAYVNGKASWKREHLTMVACAMLQAASQLGYKLEWGGLWGWDYPHFQLSEEE